MRTFIMSLLAMAGALFAQPVAAAITMRATITGTITYWDDTAHVYSWLDLLGKPFKAEIFYTTEKCSSPDVRVCAYEQLGTVLTLDTYIQKFPVPWGSVLVSHGGVDTLETQNYEIYEPTGGNLNFRLDAPAGALGDLTKPFSGPVIADAGADPLTSWRWNNLFLGDGRLWESLYFDPTWLSIDVVPEPADWAFLIVGFFGTGLAVRTKGRAGPRMS